MKISFNILKGEIDNAQDNQSNKEVEYSIGEKLKMFLAKGCCFGLCCFLTKKVGLN